MSNKNPYMKRVIDFNIKVRDRNLEAVDLTVNGIKFSNFNQKQPSGIYILNDYIKSLIFIYSGFKSYQIDPQISNADAVKFINKIINLSKRRNNTFVIGKTNGGYFGGDFRNMRLCVNDISLDRELLTVHLIRPNKTYITNTFKRI